MTKANLKKSNDVEGAWVYTPAPPHEVANRIGDWIKLPIYDISGQGDIHKIVNWSINLTIDQL